jgi:LAO/AO transport system kinase
MDAMGKEVVLVETVGVGQDEVDVARLAHTTVVVLVPGMGDEVQAIKAGILEVADIFVVNKADHPQVDRTVRDLQGMLELRGPAPDPAKGWEPPIVKTIATDGQGIGELFEAIARHRAHLLASGALSDREAMRARTEFVALLKERLLRGALQALSGMGTLDEIAARIARKQQDPYALGDELASQLAALSSGRGDKP